MKIYRRSIWKTTFRVLLQIWLVVVILVVLLEFCLNYFYHATIFYGLKGLVNGCLCLIFFILFSFLASVFVNFYYLILTRDELIICNSFLFGWEKRFGYDSIERVRFRHSPVGYWEHCMIQIYRPLKRRRSFTIDLVDPRDYQEIVDTFRAKGIEVELIYMEEWVR